MADKKTTRALPKVRRVGAGVAEAKHAAEDKDMEAAGAALTGDAGESEHAADADKDARALAQATGASATPPAETHAQALEEVVAEEAVPKHWDDISSLGELEAFLQKAKVVIRCRACRKTTHVKDLVIANPVVKDTKLPYAKFGALRYAWAYLNVDGLAGPVGQSPIPKGIGFAILTTVAFGNHVCFRDKQGVEYNGAEIATTRYPVISPLEAIKQVGMAHAERYEYNRRRAEEKDAAVLAAATGSGEANVRKALGFNNRSFHGLDRYRRKDKGGSGR